MYEYMFFRGKFMQMRAGLRRRPDAGAQAETWERDFQARRFAYNISALFVGTFLPFLTPVVYALQQGVYWAGGRYRPVPALDYALSADDSIGESQDPGLFPPPVRGGTDTGGIDWRPALQADEWLGEPLQTPHQHLPPEILDDFQGFDFRIIQIQPISNPAVFFLGRSFPSALTPT